MTIDKNRINSICFDIDGTLRDTDDQYQAKLQKLFSPLKLFISDEKISSLARWLVMAAETPGNILMSIPDILGFDDLLQKDRKTRKNPENEHPMKMVPGTIEAIHSLSGEYKMAIVSARRKSKVDQFIRQNQLEYLFPVVISALSAKRNKPHPAPILIAAQKLEVHPENILMVGDTTFDILTAKRAGAQTVGVLSGFGTPKELIRAGADLILDSVADLPGILQN
jgi:HAD superfamily hydrolase (TIGR01509 family)